MFAELGEGGGLGVGVDGLVKRDLFLGLEGLGAGFVLASDGGVEATEGVDGFDGVVGAEGEGDVVVEEALPGVGVLDALETETVGGPFHVGEQMAGLHGGDDAFAGEAVEVGREQDLGVFDAKAEAGGGGDGWGWCGDDVGVGAAGGGGRRCGVGDLLGGSEGVEGDVVGAVADGVEADLEACGGAFGGELDELVLVVTGEAGVGGVVGVGLVHGCGAGAEGAVHEALEHGEVEERIVGWVAGAALLEDGYGLVEVEPLGDAEVELAGVFELFEGEEVPPLGVVLDGGDAVGEGVVDGYVEGLAALFECGRRDFVEDEVAGGGLAEDAGGAAGGVAVDLCAGGIGGVGGDVGGGEGGGVGEGHVAVDAGEDGWVVSGDLVDVGAGGKLVAGPEGVVPAAAEEPVAVSGGGGVVADAVLHLGEGVDAFEVDGELFAAGVGDVGVGVVEAGHGEGVVQVDDSGLWAF